MSLFGDLPPAAADEMSKTEVLGYNLGKGTGTVGGSRMLSAEPNNLITLNDQLTRRNVSEGDAARSTSHSAKISLKRSSTEDVSSSETKRISLGFSTLHGFVAERKGERADMQDAHVLLDECTSQFPQLKSGVRRVAYYAVFDGHGGHRASRHCANRLHQHLIQNLPKFEVNNFPKEMKKMILQSFKCCDEEFLREASLQKPVWKDGTTACCVLILDDTMYIMNLGDSKAILCRYHAEQKKHVSISLSQDHSPTDYEERQRIQRAGGHVREGRVMGILEVSRSIGDGQYKRCGVINVPDVKRCQLSSNDRFLLIACDGLWKVYTPEEAIEFVMNVLQDNTVQIPEGSSKTLEETLFDAACNRLASEAVRKGSADNVTVLLVSIRKL